MSIETEKKKTYRSILKWGDPNHIEEPNKRLVGYVKKYMAVTDEDIKTPHLPALDEVKLDTPSALSAADLESLKNIVGKDNVDISDYERLRHSVGYSYYDVIALRKKAKIPLVDAVVCPRHEADVVGIIKFCDEKKIPLIPFGGRSSVVRGLDPIKGGISLDLTKHMNKVIKVNETNKSATVQPGMFGPAYEDYLNNYKTENSSTGYSCGHFPQSFEYSTVGGWVVTKGAGSLSTGYGKIEDMVLGLKFVTPKGIIEIKDYPRTAAGPDLRHIVAGSEGTLGVLTEVTLKVWKFRPDNRSYFSFLFKNWEGAVAALREIMQGEFGLPHMLRISDPEESGIGLMVEGITGGPIDKVLSLLGYKDGQRCILMGSTEGDKDTGCLIKKKVKAIAKKHGSLYLGASAVRGWYRHRYNDPYLRENLMDMKVMTDTVETACSWENLPKVWAGVRQVVKARKPSVCMVHASHSYENGSMLYFIFISKIKPGDEIDDYLNYHSSILNAIIDNGGSPTHHHGTGRLMAPWFEDFSGKTAMGLLRAIKAELDPNNIMNPGGTLALDFKGDKKKSFRI
jgi:alkyldihydroxyacetonephosphate synthase